MYLLHLPHLYEPYKGRDVSRPLPEDRAEQRGEDLHVDRWEGLGTKLNQLGKDLRTREGPHV